MRIWALILHLSHLSKEVSNILEAEKRRNVENKVAKGKNSRQPVLKMEEKGPQYSPNLSSLS